MPSLTGNLATNKLTLQAHGPVATGNLVMEVKDSAFTMSMGSNVLMTVAPEGVDDLVGSSSSTASTLTINRDTVIDGTLAVVDAFKVDVKDTTVNVTNSMYADILATTQNGRIALAKALNYGQSEPIFETNGYKPLLDAGYSGKGVLYGHFERAMQFNVPPLRHLVAPQHIFSTTPESFHARQDVDVRLNNIPTLSPHTYATSGMAVGFDLHAKLTDCLYGQVRFSNYNLVDQDAFVMGPAYNADMVSIEQASIDTLLVAEHPNERELFDDVWVEVVEKAFLRGVKVGQTAFNFAGSEGYYYHFDTSGTAYTGIHNPMSYIASLAADHDMVYCESAGNGAITIPSNAVPSPGSGYMYLAASEARNILSCGAKLVDDGTVYPYVQGYQSNGDLIAVDNYVINKDYAQINSYYNPSNGRYSGTPKAGYTDRVNVAHGGFGRTVDTAGPGQTHRCKPDIISAQGTDHQYLSWSSEYPGLKWVYAKLLNPATSGTSPTIAGGVCLLREALPLYDAHQIRECIMLAASNGDLSDADTDNGLGYGLINLEAALAYGQARPRKAPPSLKKGTWTYGSDFLAAISAGAVDTLNHYQPFNGGDNFTPKSVQSFKCPKDASLSADAAYQTAYTAYETAYNAYVASATHLWTAGVLDLSPPKGLWGSSATRDFSIEGPTFNVVSNKSWISADEADMQEIKDLMIANGIKVGTTSTLLGAFSVIAESPEQLASVVNGNLKIRHVSPVQKLVPVKPME